IAFHARTRKYDKLCGWYDWAITSVHFNLMGVPLTIENLDHADGSYTIDESFVPVCSMDGDGRLGVVLRLDVPRPDDDVSVVEIAVVDEDMPPLIERLVRLSIERGNTDSWPAAVSCGAFDVAVPTTGVWTGEDDVKTIFADDAQKNSLEEAQALLMATWKKGLKMVVPPLDPAPTDSEPAESPE
ncbi:hypothetical protein PENTCL1PPCAC_11999, partial [Pristionchus entomophagus]